MANYKAMIGMTTVDVDGVNIVHAANNSMREFKASKEGKEAWTAFITGQLKLRLVPEHPYGDAAGYHPYNATYWRGLFKVYKVDPLW